MKKYGTTSNGEVVYLSLGSNLGDRELYIREAIVALRNKLVDVTVSELYETSPCDFLDQPAFLNCVLKGTFYGSPEKLLEVIMEIENSANRQRNIDKGPRTLDIDILLFGDRIIERAGLIVPHPRMLKRQFVLIPLLKIDPQVRDPKSGEYVWKYYRSLGSQGVYYFSFFDN